MDEPTDIVLWTDSQSSISKIYSNKDATDASRRRRIDIADCKECLSFGVVKRFAHIDGTVNPLDIGTKRVSPGAQQYRGFIRMHYGGYFDPLEVPERRGNKR